MDSSKNITKKILADRLIEKLYQERKEETEKACVDLRVTISDLLQNLPMLTPRSLGSYRYMQSEEKRISQILNVADIVENSGKNCSGSESLSKLMKSLNLLVKADNRSQNSSVMIEYSSIFTRPSDVMQYNIERARQKYNKSVEIIKRIEGIKADEKRKTEGKIRKSLEREKKMMEEFSKRGIEHSQHTSNSTEYRQKILQKKKEIMSQLDREFMNYGTNLNKRMQKLTAANQKKIREIVQKQHEKMRARIQSDCSKIIKDEVQIKMQEKIIENLMGNLEEEISKKIRSYEENIKQRVSNIREKNLKVDRVFSKSLTDYNKRSEESLARAVKKSLVGQDKRQKKQETYTKYADSLKNTVQSSFMRNSKGLEGLNEIEIQRIKKIENRVSEKTKIFNELKNKFEEAIREKKQRNNSRFENHGVHYSRALESQAELRMRVLDKHRKINNMAEEIKLHKFELARKKRIDNFEINKIRTSFSTSNRSRYDSRLKTDV